MEAGKKKRLLTSPRFVFPLAAVIVLIVGFVIYYFIVIGRQEASVDDRALRSLSAVATQFKDLVNSYSTVLKYATQHGHGSKDSDILGFLAAQGSGLGDVDDCQNSPNGEVFRARASKNEPWIAAGVVPKDNGYSLELASNGRCSHVTLDKALSPLLAQTPNQTFDEILLTDHAGTVLYQTQRAGIVADDLAYLSWQIENARSSGGAADQGPKQAEPADKSTRPAFTRSSSTGLVSGGSDHTSEKDTSPFSRASETSSVSRIMLAGTDYRAYLVPVRLQVPSPSASATEVGARFVLCGLIRQDHFRTASRSLPLTILASIALAVFLVIVAAWPVLKFATMQRTEDITRRAGLYYALFSAATIIVLMLFIIHVNYGFSDPKTDDNLKDLALAIDRNVATELRRALHVMESVGENHELKDARFVPYEKLPCPSELDQHPTVARDLLSKVGMQVAEYPYFRRLNVLDSQGFEQVQWTVDAKEPPPIRVCDRPYFQRTLRDDLWYLRDEGLSGQRFRVDPIYSKSTGEYLAAIAKRFTIKQAGTPGDSGVMTMVTPMLSLIRPVLPPDYGFAVIDESGKVLFHSESAKNGRENFFDESRDDKALKAAVLARRAGSLDINYLGADYEVFLTPFAQIQQCPWTLIVFSNRLVLGDKQLERIVLLAILAGMYFALLVAAILLLRLWLPCYDLVWPKESLKASYCHLLCVLVVIILLSYALVFEGSPKEVLWFAAIIPASSITFVILKLKAKLNLIVGAVGMFAIGSLLVLAGNDTISSLGWRGSPYFSTALICAAYLSLGSKSITNHFAKWKKSDLATVYSLGSFALFLLIAALPCIAFFKISFDYDENLSTRRQQLLTMAALEDRERQVRNQYFRVTVSGKSSDSAHDLGRWLFLRRRLQEETLDLYDKAFQDQQPGQIYSSEKTPNDTSQSSEKTPNDTSQWPGWLTCVATNWVPRRAGSLTQQVTGESLAGSKWKWSEQGANRIHVDSHENAGTEEEGSPETMALAKLAFQDPQFLAPHLTHDLAVLKPTDFLKHTWFLTAILLMCMYWSIRSTIVKIFLLDKKIEEWTGTTLQQAIVRDGNSILVGLPCSGKTKWLQDCEQNGTIRTIDVATGVRGGVIDRTTDKKVIALDHFEYGIDDTLANQWKINLLEELMFDKEGKYRTDRKVVIVSTVDPRFYFENADRAPVDTLSTGTPKEADVERWTRVLSRFDVFRLEAVSAPVSNKFYHHFLWSTCTWSEKIALHSLAERGWANHKNYSALEHLCNRGLIKLDPGRISDEKFRKYVSSSITRQERESLALRDRGGLWDGLRTTLIVLLLGGLAAILFFNQNEVLGYFASGISALTAASKIVSEVRGRRVAEAGKGGAESA